MDTQQQPTHSHTALELVDSDERKLCEVAKHPFGIVVLYIQVAIGMCVALGLSFFLLPTIITDVNTGIALASVFGIVLIMIAVLVILVATLVYRQNRLIVTDRNITQILQYGLFNRKVSQLNLVNVEDVTSIQDGVFSTMLGFGDLKIETAGEQANFHFTYCPRPGYYAKIILEAREKILGQHDGDARVVSGYTTTR
jgi:uncharacterized membrane protein YdbT with pleckstrin-like domain